MRAARAGDAIHVDAAVDVVHEEIAARASDDEVTAIDGAESELRVARHPDGEVVPHFIVHPLPPPLIMAWLAADVITAVADDRLDRRLLLGEVKADVAFSVCVVARGFGADGLVNAHLHRRVAGALNVDEPVD